MEYRNIRGAKWISSYPGHGEKLHVPVHEIPPKTARFALQFTIARSRDQIILRSMHIDDTQREKRTRMKRILSCVFSCERNK